MTPLTHSMRRVFSETSKISIFFGDFEKKIRIVNLIVENKVNYQKRCKLSVEDDKSGPKLIQIFFLKKTQNVRGFKMRRIWHIYMPSALNGLNEIGHKQFWSRFCFWTLLYTPKPFFEKIFFRF